MRERRCRKDREVGRKSRERGQARGTGRQEGSLAVGVVGFVKAKEPAGKALLFSSLAG